MTGDQAALFDAPQHEGQAALFGGLFLAADELDDLAAAERLPRAVSCPECGCVHRAYAGTPHTERCSLYQSEQRIRNQESSA